MGTDHQRKERGQRQECLPVPHRAGNPAEQVPQALRYPGHHQDHGRTAQGVYAGGDRRLLQGALRVQSGDTEGF